MDFVLRRLFTSANIIPIPKGSKVNLSDSDKYRSIAISSILGKILDHIIIVKQSDTLITSQHQYGFKANSSTVLCSTLVIETVQYYTYTTTLLLHNATLSLLYFMYTNQSCNVKWDQCTTVRITS